MTTQETTKLTAIAHHGTNHTPYVVSSINGAPATLKTRLLEVGLISKSRIEVARTGAHYLIKLRGDTLLLRAEEASYIRVFC